MPEVLASPIPQHSPYASGAGKGGPDPRNYKDVAVICSISEMELQGHCGVPPDERTINARKNGESYALTTVYGQTEYYDLGDDRKGNTYWSAEQLANSLLCKHNPMASLEREGAFLCAGATPTNEELETAKVRFETFALEQIRDADAEYSRNPLRPEVISDRQRRLAKALGLDKPWLPKMLKPTICPSCGESVQPTAAKCRFCSFILKPEMWASLNPAVPPSGEREAQTEIKTGHKGAAR